MISRTPRKCAARVMTSPMSGDVTFPVLCAQPAPCGCRRANNFGIAHRAAPVGDGASAGLRVIAKADQYLDVSSQLAGALQQLRRPIFQFHGCRCVMRTGGADPQKPQCRRGGLPFPLAVGTGWTGRRRGFPFPAVGFPMRHSEPMIITPADGASK